MGRSIALLRACEQTKCKVIEKQRIVSPDGLQFNYEQSLDTMVLDNGKQFNYFLNCIVCKAGKYS